MEPRIENRRSLPVDVACGLGMLLSVLVPLFALWRLHEG